VRTVTAVSSLDASGVQRAPPAALLYKNDMVFRCYIHTVILLVGLERSLAGNSAAVMLFSSSASLLGAITLLVFLCLRDGIPVAAAETSTIIKCKNLDGRSFGKLAT